jgi:predicted glycosyltransferase
VAMRILIEIGHPAHVHFFRHPINSWKSEGHDLLVVSRDKEMTNHLLKAYAIDSICASKAGHGAVSLFKEMLIRDLKLWQLARRFKPDILTSIGGTWISQVSKLIRKPAIVFYDTENASLSNAITYPLVAALCTPKCYQNETKLGVRHLRYPGYHELAYLHPNRFQPDLEVLSAFGLGPSNRYFIVRFVSWGASHDLHQKGMSFQNKKNLIDMLSNHGRVFITSEGFLPYQLKKYSSPIPAEHIHHAMGYATMVIGESATMASEAAALGVPAIYISDISRGYILEQEKDYGLVYHFMNKQTDEAFMKIRELLRRSNVRDEWKEKRKRMLNDSIDVTSFVVDVVANYPESLHRYRRQWSALQEFNSLVKDE